MIYKNAWAPSIPRREPAELLKPLVDPATWSPKEMANSEVWMYRLSDAEADEIENAVAKVEASKKDLTEITAKDFRLPTLGPKLSLLQTELMHGRGFAMVRGVRLDRMTPVQGAIAFWGVGSYIGRMIPQTSDGRVLEHVKYTGGEGDKDRAYSHKAALGYHCDNCDILGLGVVSTGLSGGEHRIASSATLYNELLKARPDLVKELGENFYRRRAGEEGYGPGNEFIVQRCFNFQNGWFSCRSVGASVLRAQRYENIPRMMPLQVEAVETFKKMAPEVSLLIPFQRGDFFFVMNYTMMHSRTAYEDGPGNARHLMRLWLHNGLRPLPPEVRASGFGPAQKVDRVTAILEPA